VIEVEAPKLADRWGVSMRITPPWSGSSGFAVEAATPMFATGMTLLVERLDYLSLGILSFSWAVSFI
jgi:hypothetical protein